MMNRNSIPFAVALALLIVAGFSHGRWGGRGEAAEALREASGRLDRLPASIGEWSGTETPIDRRGLDRAGIVGLVARRYENRRTGAAVSLLLVCGPPGPIAAHGPEVCYAGSGYEPAGSPVRVPVAAADTPARDTFWTGDFWMADAGAPTPPLRIAWSWTADGRWRAEDRPRLGFAGNLVLYKLYLVHEPSGPGSDPGLAFAGLVVPELRKVLFPIAAATGAMHGPRDGRESTTHFSSPISGR